MGRPKGFKSERFSQVKIICEECGKEFWVRRYRISKARFCSRKCLGKNTYVSARKGGLGAKGRTPHNKKFKDKKEWRRDYQRRFNLTPTGKLSSGMGVLLRQCLKKNKNGQRWEKLVGYKVNDLKHHLEKLFISGMNWGNYGRYGWHIDHKIPISAFNYRNQQDIDFNRCWSLSNLQPMWAKDNLKKHNKIDGQFQPSLNLALYNQRAKLTIKEIDDGEPKDLL